MSSAMFPISMKVSTAENPSSSTWAWPGRPGGNGDGSEEWMQGSYGQMNGPYKLISTSSGEVSHLNSHAGNSWSLGL